LPTEAALAAALDDVFGAAAQTGRTSTVFAIGIDGWAAVAKAHGPHAAETALRRSAERLAQALRKGDQLAWLGEGVFGAAFAPVPRADLETALQAAARLQEALREPIVTDGMRIALTASVGFCLAARAPGASGEAALRAARQALAEAEAAGPGAVRAYSAGMPAAQARKDLLDTEAVEALESGQIVPWFQPQISTDTGKVTGFEILARWEHPSLGLVPPAEFLPALAEAGRSERLGELMLSQALPALKAWDAAGLGVQSLGVNLTLAELRNPRLADKLAWELDRHGFGPDRLAVEILETVVIETRDETAARTICALSKAGFRIDLDDFGVGNASLAALRRFPVSRIKIDRSFVAKLDEDRAQQKMLAALVSLAEGLGIETLAEGVERVGEHAMAAQLGCGYVQGFGVARPMPFGETVAWVKRHNARLTDAALAARRAI
jgi:diguanylate cyclase (GGDEF)-like protein